MINIIINKILNRYGAWRFINALLLTGNLLLVCIIVLEIATPVRLDSKATDVSSNVNAATVSYLSDTLKSKPLAIEQLIEVIKPNLFKASTSPQAKPMTEETIEKIKSKLKLQCILNINGEPIAYVNIQDVGLKKCKIGDSVSDLFTVLNISQGNIELSIIGHKVTLSL